jgi:hypothetical protein
LNLLAPDSWSSSAKFTLGRPFLSSSILGGQMLNRWRTTSRRTSGAQGIGHFELAAVAWTSPNGVFLIVNRACVFRGTALKKFTQPGHANQRGPPSFKNAA